jgi:O-antigen/teichoic acid export membrane protein
VHKQITNLQKRLALTRLMQIFGVPSFIICSLSMMGLFFKYTKAAEILFGFSLLFLVLSLLVSLYEILISTDAIKIELLDLEQHSEDKEH